MKLTYILQVTVQFMITEVAAISWRQLQNSQLHSPGRSARRRRALCFTFSISLDTENMAKEGYQSMLQNLIRSLKDGRNGWVNQGELFTLSLLPGVPEKYRLLINNRTKVFCLSLRI